jgi:LEA14-like dessication related protein
MNKILPIILLSVFSLTTVAQNKVSFKANRHDFGTVDRQKDEFVEATFEITNPNQAPLVIYKVDVSCNCISSFYTSKPIKKGETGYVKLRLHVRQLGSNFNKTAFVKTNAPDDNGVLLLRVTGTVK